MQKDTSTNLSKIKREHLLEICSRIKNNEKVDTLEIVQLEQFIKSIKYGLNFEQHQEQVDINLLNKIPIFIEDIEKKISTNSYNKESSHYNFLLEGDNLHSLKLLEKTHKGAIDVIYIDPPYNTGNEFKYNDKIIGKDDGYRHSKWLSFMSQRLQIAYKLLTTSGIIFISIDDNEYANLKLLCDEIFGKENFITNFIWRKTGQQQNNGTNISIVTEYILCYAKNLSYKDKKKNLLRKDNIKNRKGFKMYSHYDEKKQEYYRLNPIQDKSLGKHEYTLINPKNNKKVHSKYWRITEKKYNELLDKDMIYWTENLPNVKKYLDLSDNVLPNNIIDGIYNETGNQDLQKVLGPNSFTNPKPVELIKKLIKFYHKDDITVLDFFAGSGTTGQAVWELNKEDGGKRQFILCTNNENNICEEVTFKRLKTVITGMCPDGSKYSDSIPANLKYFKAEMIEKNDDDLDEKLLEACIPLIELQKGIDIENEEIEIAFCDEDLEKILTQNKKTKTIYIVEDILLSSKQKNIINEKNIEVIEIPNYFYNFI